MNPEKNINFCIIAHIDHGKSTLADRILEMTGAVDGKKMRPQFLDSMDLEREKGITIKLKAIRMELDELKIKNLKLKIPSSEYILNLVDTPGHVDFSYEVSRSLAAVEGAVLLVDATQGLQAQTLANLELAKKQGLIVIPVVNKIDSPQAKTEETVEELANLLNINPAQIIRISAKEGTNVDQVLERIVKDIPSPPEKNLANPFRCLIFDSDYDSYKGVVAYVRVVDGAIEQGEKINLLAAGVAAEAKEIGYFSPGRTVPQKRISAGEIGYIATGIKKPGLVRVGDTIIKFQNLLPAKRTPRRVASKIQIAALPGYREPEPMVFASFYPSDPDQFDLLKDALSKLKLNDPAFVFEPETREALGRGFRCGFLGTLHIEIVSERLRREFGLDLVISTPSVVYKIINQSDKEFFVYSASDWPDSSAVKRSEEPWVLLKIVTPFAYSGKIMEIAKNIGASYKETKYLSKDRTIIVYEVPLREIITSLYDKIKSVSQGYASMNYKVLSFRSGDLVKLEVLVAGEKKEAFSRIVPKSDAYREGKFLVERLKEVLPAEQFSIALQAVVGGDIIARETVKARRKDVTGYLYGGDYTRKRKLLEKQKKGKKLLKQKGRVKIPPDVFLKIFRGR